jgi:hypothetical protein
MQHIDLLRVLHDAGVTLELRGGKLLVHPAERLTDGLRTSIREHKPALLDFLVEVTRQAADLIDAAMRVCDHHGDGEEARADMRADCLATPPHLRVDLLDHLTSITGTTAENSAEPDPKHFTLTPGGPKGNA